MPEAENVAEAQVVRCMSCGFEEEGAYFVDDGITKAQCPECTNRDLQILA